MRLSLAFLAAVIATPVYAQSIDVAPLDAAKAFAPGLDVDGALDAAAWQGTSAARATRLLTAAPLDTTDAITRDMLRRVVLAGLSPPAAASAETERQFARTRIRAAQALASPSEYDAFAARNPLANEPRLRADAFVATGQLQRACEISDALTQGRGEPHWIRLRAACHDARGETAAAELARDLLRDDGEATELDMPEQTSGLFADVMTMSEPDRNGYLSNLSIEGLSAEDGFEFDLASAQADSGNRGTAQLYQLGRGGDAKAVALYVARAVEAGVGADAVLSGFNVALDPTDMAAADLSLFARHAVAIRDLGLLRALYEATDDEAARQRIALASDALGGGFYRQPLGAGLESELDQAPALADLRVALALGADLSETAEAALIKTKDIRLSPDWISVQAAEERGARAELLLRLAGLRESGSDSYTLISTLRRAGFSDLAGQIAAYHFLDAL